MRKYILFPATTDPPQVTVKLWLPQPPLMRCDSVALGSTRTKYRLLSVNEHTPLQEHAPLEKFESLDGRRRAELYLDANTAEKG